MRHEFWDKYSHRAGLLQKIDIRVKLLLAFIFLLSVVSTEPSAILSFIVYGGIISWLSVAACVPFIEVVKKSLLVLPFGALVAIWLPFLNKAPYIELWKGGLKLSIVGLIRFYGVLAKGIICSSMVILLGMTSKFDLLLQGLRAFYIPGIFLDWLSLTYRYVFVLAEEAMKLKMALYARGFKGRWLKHASIIGMLIANLILRSINRSEYVFYAMQLRGYSPGGIVKDNLPKMSGKDKVVLFAGFILIFIIRFFIGNIVFM